MISIADATHMILFTLRVFWSAKQCNRSLGPEFRFGPKRTVHGQNIRF